MSTVRALPQAKTVDIEGFIAQANFLTMLLQPKASVQQISQALGVSIKTAEVAVERLRQFAVQPFDGGARLRRSWIANALRVTETISPEEHHQMIWAARMVRASPYAAFRLSSAAFEDLGDKEKRLSSFSQAADNYQIAIAVLKETDPLRQPLKYKFARALSMSGDSARAFKTYTEILSEAVAFKMLTLASQALYEICRQSWTNADCQTGIRLVEETLDAIGLNDTSSHKMEIKLGLTNLLTSVGRCARRIRSCFLLAF